MTVSSNPDLNGVVTRALDEWGHRQHVRAILSRAPLA